MFNEFLFFLIAFRYLFEIPLLYSDFADTRIQKILFFVYKYDKMKKIHFYVHHSRIYMFPFGTIKNFRILSHSHIPRIFNQKKRLKLFDYNLRSMDIDDLKKKMKIVSYQIPIDLIQTNGILFIFSHIAALIHWNYLFFSDHISLHFFFWSYLFYDLMCCGPNVICYGHVLDEIDQIWKKRWSYDHINRYSLAHMTVSKIETSKKKSFIRNTLGIVLLNW